MDAEKQIRNRALDVVRVVAMIFVTFIHSPGATVGSSPVVYFLKSFIAGGAVPVFFLLSGYLGARKLNLRTYRFQDFAREKARTLVAPFLFWNLLVLLLALAARKAGFSASLRGGGAYFDVTPDFSSVIAALIGFGRYPIVYQFWFLRNLIVIVFVAFFICRWLPSIPLLPWLFFFVPLPMAPLVGTLPIGPCLGFYLLGHDLSALLPPSRFPLVQPCLLYCACWTLMGAGVIGGIVSIPDSLGELGSAAFIFMFAVAISATSFGARLSLLGPSVFFVYATHEPLQTLIGRLWQAHQWPGFGTLICFLLIPAFVYPCCVLAHGLLQRVAPRAALFVTGGR
jgi:fucose 4-O-acetylase-like acetyltransferase